MYKMLIVDDKSDERQYLKSIISWKEYNIDIVGEAENGIEAMLMVNQLLPDIIITDIIMPKMDGIEMSKKILETFPSIKIVFTSCYDEFRYAQLALRNGITDYILKPVMTNEIEAIIAKLVSDLSSKNLIEKKDDTFDIIQSNIDALQQIFIKDLIEEKYTEELYIYNKLEAYQLQHLYNKYVYVMQIDFEDCVQNNFQSVLGNILPASSMYVFFKDCYHTVIVTCDQQSYKELPYVLREELTGAGYQNITIGISTVKEGLVNIPNCYKEASEALSCKFYLGKNRLIFCEDLETVQYNEKNFDIKDIYERLKRVLYTYDKNDIKLFSNEVIDTCITKDKLYVKTILMYIINCCHITLLNIGQSFENIFGNEMAIYEKIIKIDTIPDIKLWLYNILMSINTFLVEKEDRRANHLADAVKDFINKNYSKKITMEDISSQIHFHPIYANSKFKQITGKTFLQYLLEVRIQKAMELLKLSECKIYEISEMVGYWNRSYFTLAFKEYTGMTPKEFRDKFIEKGAN